MTLIFFEIFEMSWQKSPTIEQTILKLNGYYQKSIFIFFLMHPSFYFVLLIIMATKVFNFWMIAILFLKTIDIFIKLKLIKLHKSESMDEKMRELIKAPLNQWLFFSGVGLYPFLLFYGLI